MDVLVTFDRTIRDSAGRVFYHDGRQQSIMLSIHPPCLASSTKWLNAYASNTTFEAHAVSQKSAPENSATPTIIYDSNEREASAIAAEDAVRLTTAAPWPGAHLCSQLRLSEHFPRTVFPTCCFDGTQKLQKPQRTASLLRKARRRLGDASLLLEQQPWLAVR